MESTTPLLGRSIKIFLHDGGAFYFKVLANGPGYIRGYDDECNWLQVDLVDIKFIQIT